MNETILALMAYYFKEFLLLSDHLMYGLLTHIADALSCPSLPTEICFADFKINDLVVFNVAVIDGCALINSLED